MRFSILSVIIFKIYFDQLKCKIKKKNLTRAPLNTEALDSTDTKGQKYCVDQVMEHSQQAFGIQKNMQILYLHTAVIWKPDK